jgi:hypothetical protein
MTENALPNPTPPAGSGWLAEPYAERHILAGFLKPGEVEIVYPAALEWPSNVTESVRSLHGTGAALGTREEAGQCRISNIEEPEALAVLDPVARSVQAGPAVPMSYAWVEIRNLIAAGSVADPLPMPRPLSNDDARAIADYSLRDYGGQPLLSGNGILITSVPLNISFAGAEVRGNQYLVQYALAPLFSPIVVGYEQGRCYLLKEYGRVLYAISQNVERLLCLVYYGLNLTEPNMGVKALGQQGDAFNHFGAERLGGAVTPLVRDFLNPAVTAIVPSRAQLFAAMPSVQSLGMEFDPLPQGGLPLSGPI